MTWNGVNPTVKNVENLVLGVLNYILKINAPITPLIHVD